VTFVRQPLWWSAFILRPWFKVYSAQGGLFPTPVILLLPWREAYQESSQAILRQPQPASSGLATSSGRMRMLQRRTSLCLVPGFLWLRPCGRNLKGREGRVASLAGVLLSWREEMRVKRCMVSDVRNSNLGGCVRPLPAAAALTTLLSCGVPPGVAGRGGSAGSLEED